MALCEGREHAPLAREASGLVMAVTFGSMVGYRVVRIL